MTMPESPERAELDLEAPEEDAQEQSQPANPLDGRTEPVEVHLNGEVGEYDAVEQAREVDLDDDY